MLSSRHKRGRIAFIVVGVGFGVWSTGSILGNVLTARDATDRSALIANHGFHGIAYLLFAIAVFIVRDVFLEAWGRISITLAYGGLLLLGGLNIFGAYQFVGDMRGPTHWSLELIAYGIPAALLMLGCLQ